MSATELLVYYDADADPGRLRRRTIAIIGYGRAAPAWSWACGRTAPRGSALQLRDWMCGRWPRPPAPRTSS